ncbi:MAG: hypothetical protein QW589_04895 [Candidatus Bathyarchaeia archaeon]
MKKEMKFREGDFIETKEHLIFDVKGFIHPPKKVIAFLRYIPDKNGDRKRGNLTFKKIYSLNEKNELLKKLWPNYLSFDKVFGKVLPLIPFSNILCYYDPIIKLKELKDKIEKDSLEQSALGFAEMLIDDTGIPSRFFGISGSLLVSLHKIDSDIDLIVYGEKNSFKVYDSLKALFSSNKALKHYDEFDIKNLYKTRGMEKSMDFNVFLYHERRKFLEGKFKGKDFFIRCVKDWNEIKESYGKCLYREVGNVVLKAKVEHSSEAIFTPSRYKIKDVRILKGDKEKIPIEIISFRGRFCEQAFENEKIMARGKLEKVLIKNEEFFRLVIGEDPKDFLICLRD